MLTIEDYINTSRTNGINQSRPILSLRIDAHNPHKIKLITDTHLSELVQPSPTHRRRPAEHTCALVSPTAYIRAVISTIMINVPESCFTSPKVNVMFNTFEVPNNMYPPLEYQLVYEKQLNSRNSNS